MNDTLFIRHLSRCIASLAAAALCFVAYGCEGKARTDGNSISSGQESERPAALSDLSRSLADGDAVAFASMCSYPIQRRYPLRNVEDSASMVDYFPVMVDDSLRAIASDVDPGDWENRGWRGWALGDPVVIWFDEGVQFVDYESKAESGLRRLLARDEMLSLKHPLGEGWMPVETLVEVGGDKVFRIDSVGGIFRLMEYPDRSVMREMPLSVLTGPLTLEGTASSRIYIFSDSVGNKATYLPDAEEPVCIVVERPGKGSESLPVKRAYWRDLLR